MSGKKGSEDLLKRRARLYVLLSWFSLFEAAGIRSANLTLTRRELELELERNKLGLKERKK